MNTTERTCTECGNDLATEGYVLCIDCLERTNTMSNDKRPPGTIAGTLWLADQWEAQSAEPTLTERERALMHRLIAELRASLA